MKYLIISNKKQIRKIRNIIYNKEKDFKNRK